MKSVFFLFASVLLAPTSHALTDDQQFLEQLRDQSAALLEQSLPPDGFKPPEISAKDKAWIDSLLAKQQQAQQQAADAAKAQAVQESPFVYFVSFSISEAGLKQMVPEATQLGIPTLINGLIDNDFRKTASAVFELTKDSGEGGVQIDPKTFTQYGITQVPALVVRCEQGFDVVYGNIRLVSAIERIASSGDCHEVARDWLVSRARQ
ncbi:type-F conjugative transfer system pilin assembly protein TrbC [Providencia hangzhouensis]|uniref:type-F conjugative transfer system pilin assembly protein TrbC n=1 Tax=Providencia TaxID=586 RepID=UPI001D9A807C|nr:type-F conjugative transfer system pilin assembly protein TrbC [Providencia sp. PROV258]EIU9513667.1 type-F conjugative transfer system pilin assembly protein TrbC [Providencia rettgeri]ELR5267237.1 type-F conjugative transfer system pilin assembly protein TrbC [Providencia rettgeri]